MTGKNQVRDSVFAGDWGYAGGAAEENSVGVDG
jgi:hypothetical protein